MGSPPSDGDIVATLADDLPVGVWVARAPAGEFVYANKTFNEIMGSSAGTDVFVANSAEPWGLHTRNGQRYPDEKLPFRQALRTRATVTSDDLVVHRRDGRHIHIRAEARPVFDARGDLTHVVIAFNDITREVAAEAARADSEARLRHAQKMESIGSLAGGIAHDFNNLIAVVKMIASTMKMNETDPDKLECLSEIDQVTHSAQQLTKSLLGFARRGKNLSERVSLNEVVQSVAELAMRTVDRRIQVTIDCTARSGEVVGDISQLEQLIMNLAVNARDAIPGPGHIVLRTRDVVIGENEARRLAPLKLGPHVVLEVSDDGVGIDAAIRERIFEPYFTTKTGGAQRGTGLGLATVYGVLQTHNGAIEVLDNRPRGTIMRVILPSAPASQRPRRPPTPALGIRIGSGTVLVVDDEPLVRTASTRALRSLGYDVLSASDGVEAVDEFRQHHRSIDAVMLDMVMPRMSGRETYLALREIDPTVKVLLTTGYALNEEAQRILDLGVRGFIAKPFEVAALSAAISMVIEPS